MVILTTTRDQIRVGAAAKRAGGYDELIRLDREKRVAGKNAVLKRRPDGRLYYARSEEPESASEEGAQHAAGSRNALRGFRAFASRLFARFNA